MATIRYLSWNVQVWGPTKYGVTPNNVAIARVVARTIVEANADIAAVMEIRTSVAPQIAFTVGQLLNQNHQTWSYFLTPARAEGNAESYVIFYRTDRAFAYVASGLSSVEFPNNFSATHGRKAAYAVFRTTDTNAYFAATVYHAPPNQQAQIGVHQLAVTPELYAVPVGGGQQAIAHCLLAGDYNMDAHYDAPAFAPLTNPRPANPPPNAPGQGAGAQAGLAGNAIAQSTLLGTLAQAINAYGVNPNQWPAGSTNYRQRDQTIDNIYLNGGNPAADVVDMLQIITNPPQGSQVRAIVNHFVRTYQDGTAAFPNALMFPAQINAVFNQMGWVFLLYRYAISDHLPVVGSVTV